MNTFLDAALDFVVAHGPTLALGTTIVLLGGCAAMRACRHPAERRRLGVLTSLAVGLYLLAAVLPLPRWTLPTRVSPAPAAPLATIGPAPVPPLDPDQRAAILLAQLDRLLPATASSAGPTTPTSAPGAPAGIAWPRLLAAAYLALAAAVLLRAALGLLRLRAVVRTARPGPPALAEAAGLPAGTRFCVAARPVRPFCAGWLRPVVVLPAALLAPRHRSQALAVLRHEAAHLRAKDPLVQVLLAVLAVPLVAHPLFWWLARDVRFASELLADDAAAAGAGRADYARELLQLAERDQPTLAAVGTVPVFHRPSEFFRRIQMLLQREGPLSTSTSRVRRTVHALAAFALVAGAASVFGVPLAAQEPAPASPVLREQNDRLRAELDALRAELQVLRAAMQQTAPPGTASADTATGLKAALDRRANPAAADQAPEPGVVDVGGERFRYSRVTGVPGQADTTPPGTLFGSDGSGLPTHVVDPAAAERTAPVASTEAIADLTTRCLDLQAALELAEVTAAETKQLADAGHATHLEAKKAAVQLQTLRRKYAIAQQLVDGEIAATESELQWLKRKRRDADKTDALRLDMQEQRARTRLQALRAVK